MLKLLKNIFSIINTAEKRRLKSFIFFDVLISLLDIAFLALLIYVVNFYTGAKTTSHFSTLNFFTKNPLSLIFVFFFLFAAKNALGYYVLKMEYRFVYGVAARLSKNKLSAFLKGNYIDHVNTDSSVHIHKISQQPIQFGQYILGGFQQIIGQSVLVLFTIIAILSYDPFLFLLLLIILTPPLIFIGMLIRKKLRSIRKTAKPVSEKTIQHLQEALAGYVESNVFQRSDFFLERYSSYQEKFNDFLSRQLSVQNLPSRFMEVFALFGLLVLIVVNYYGKNVGNIQLVTVGAFMAAAYKIIPGVVKIINNIGQIKTYQHCIQDLLEVKNVAQEKANEYSQAINSYAMNNISFGHKAEMAISNFSLKLSKGTLTGLSGTSGKGKTTVVNLLLGFLEQRSGEIFINDKISSTTNRKLYCKRIAYVKQDTFLIHGSVRQNITLQETGENEEWLSAAINNAGLSTLLNSLPDGLETLITENGKNISGGQRQRIAIARALYKEADLIILDEPFNELDTVSENMLLKHFRSLAKQDKIILLITHNKESLDFCDSIIDMHEA